MAMLSRRDWLKGSIAGAVMSSAGWTEAWGVKVASSPALQLPEVRPPRSERRFTSAAVEALIPAIQAKIADPALRTIFSNCYPNTLDTTVFPGRFEGKPDTFVVTGDIDAMWLRDSSAQLWPYLPLAKNDDRLRELIEGVIRRQTRLILLDPYANAFLRDPSDPPLSWAIHDKTEHRPGVGERKWEVDSLCYPVRLAHGYWQETGDTKPFDAQWRAAAAAIVRTFREQQRKTGPGPYSFQRMSDRPTETCALDGFGNPARPVGMIYSMFRPSDDACIYPLFVPANLFAVLSLRQLAELASSAAGDAALAMDATALADEVERATNQYGKVNHAEFGQIWAYEVDGYGNTLRMDDANVPGLLSLAYLGCCDRRDALYQRTRAFAWSEWNPYFFKGSAAEGIGGPHEGLGMVWPMSILMRAFTTENDGEIAECLGWLRSTTAGTGFMHESFDKNDPSKYTRAWFAWANTLFGELLVKFAAQKPGLLAATF